MVAKEFIFSTKCCFSNWVFCVNIIVEYLISSLHAVCDAFCDPRFESLLSSLFVICALNSENSTAKMSCPRELALSEALTG